MLRIWHPLSQLPGRDDIIVDGNEAHHLQRVRRIRRGEPVEVLTGNGGLLKCSFEGPEGRAVRLRIKEVVQLPGRSVQLRLGVSILKGGAMDQLVRDVTQIGVDWIVPLYTAHSEVRLDPRRGVEKARRWLQVAIESCKQCGNPWLPEMSEPQTLDEFLSHQDAGLLCCASLQPQARYFRQLLPASSPKRITWLVGPEGDFSAAEYTAIASAGAAPVRLSAQVLRAETAAVYALAVTEYELALAGRLPIARSE